MDFSIESESEDLTQYFLEQDRLLMIVSYNLETAEKEGLLKLKSISDQALKEGYTVIGLSASGDEVKRRIKTKYDLNFEFFICDEKALKTGPFQSRRVDASKRNGTTKSTLERY